MSQVLGSSYRMPRPISQPGSPKRIYSKWCYIDIDIHMHMIYIHCMYACVLSTLWYWSNSFIEGYLLLFTFLRFKGYMVALFVEIHMTVNQKYPYCQLKTGIGPTGLMRTQEVALCYLIVFGNM